MRFLLAFGVTLVIVTDTSRVMHQKGFSMLLPILQWPDPRLTTRCAAVHTFDVALLRLTEDMLATMYAANGRGLAAPQVGVLQQIFVMDSSWKTGPRSPRMFFNPRIVTSDPPGGWVAPTETVVNEESCLSIPDRTVRIARPAAVRLVWHDHAERDCIGDFSGFEAVCVQHEIDHLDGVLCIDHPMVAALAVGGAA